MNTIIQNIKRLKNNKGFTLVESVATLLLATLVTGLFLVLVNLAKDTYVSMQEMSQGQILASNLTNAIQDELRYATNVRTEGTAVNGAYEFTYISHSLGKGGRSKLVSAVATNGTKNKLYIYFDSDKDEETDLYALIGSDSYIFNLEANLDCRYNTSNKRFYVSVTIYDSVTNAEIITTKFTVDPLNKHTV